MDSKNEERKGPGHARRWLASAGLVGSGLLA
jgi:hypothetical protein